MKHLSPIRLSELADGLDASAPEAAHLHACADCRGELDGLLALVQGLAPMPAPPKGLHQATLRRLGLAPAAAPAWRSPWLWAPALTAGLACALLWTPRPCAPPLPPAAAPAQHPGPRAMAGPAVGPTKGPLPPCAPREDAAAPEASAAAPGPAGGSLASAPQAQAPAAVGAQPAQPATPAAMDVRGDQPPVKPASSPDALDVTSIRNNLLRSGGGERFSLVVQMAGAGSLDATVLDAQGRTVATLFHGPAGPGETEIQWDGAAPSGAYTVLIQTRGVSRRVRVLVVH